MWQGVPQSYSSWKERVLELCCPALNISELSDVGMPTVVLNDPKMERGIRKVNQVIDQLEQVAETCIGAPDRKRGDVTLAV
jgi:hypothetical protein